MTIPLPLDAAIEATREGDPGAIATLGRVLLASSVTVPVRDDGRGGASVVVLEHEGAPYVPAYTSTEAAERCVPVDQPTATVAVRDLVQTWDPRIALALNPGTEPSGWLEGPGIVQLRGAETVEVPTGTQVRIGEPAEEPTPLLSDLRAVLTPRIEVVAAHRAQVWFGAHGEEPHLLVVLVVDGDGELASSTAAEVAASLPAGGPTVDVVGHPVGVAPDALLTEVLALPPFHVRA
jgi:hypothetical protein